jgi:hypothetical protein
MCCRIDYFGRWIVSGTNYIINNLIVITVCLIRGNIGMINKWLIGMRPLTFIVEISLVSIWDGVTGRLIIVVQIAAIINITWIAIGGKQQQWIKWSWKINIWCTGKFWYWLTVSDVFHICAFLFSYPSQAIGALSYLFWWHW